LSRVNTGELNEDAVSTSRYSRSTIKYLLPEFSNMYNFVLYQRCNKKYTHEFQPKLAVFTPKNYLLTHSCSRL